MPHHYSPFSSFKVSGIRDPPTPDSTLIPKNMYTHFKRCYLRITFRS
jgi:hypothetical protein